MPVGNAGWYPRGGEKSSRGQQPLEAAAMVDAAFAALDVTGDERWREVAEIAHAVVLRPQHAPHHRSRPTAAAATGSTRAASTATWARSRPMCYLMSAIALANRSTKTLRLAR